MGHIKQTGHVQDEGAIQNQGMVDIGYSGAEVKNSAVPERISQIIG